ncbi:MAG: hypothetical protein KAZ85_01255, partial [Gammaproteobacteria bacterium]|nr:hypothetical protein [Gammaproteobacteria bacterium]
MKSCWSCWFSASPYLGVILALAAWWLSWESTQAPALPADVPLVQETVRFEESESEDEAGLQVTLIPAPNFSSISLSDDRKQSFIAWLLPL